MPAAILQSPFTSRFGDFLVGFCEFLVVCLRRNDPDADLVLQMLSRLRNNAIAFIRLTMGVVPRKRAGRTRAPGSRATRSMTGDDGGARPARGWLMGRYPAAAAYAAQLRAMADDPSLAALLEAAPLARRIMRAMWRMLSADPYPPPLRSRRRAAAARLGDGSGAGAGAGSGAGFGAGPGDAVAEGASAGISPAGDDVPGATHAGDDAAVDADTGPDPGWATICADSGSADSGSADSGAGIHDAGSRLAG